VSFQRKTSRIIGIHLAFAAIYCFKRILGEFLSQNNSRLDHVLIRFEQRTHLNQVSHFHIYESFFTFDYHRIKYFVAAMTSKTRQICGSHPGCKSISVTNCEGCQARFCIQHFNEHRHALNKELDEISGGYDELNDLFIQKHDSIPSHATIDKINQWEKESIAIIQQRAQGLRDQFTTLEKERVNEFSNKFQRPALEIGQARQENSYIETDLLRWKELLKDLRTRFTVSSAIYLAHHEDLPLVPKPYINVQAVDESFEKVFDESVGIEEEGKSAVFRGHKGYTEVRGRTMYTFGCHKLNLRIENSAKQWIFLGINSKSIPLKDRSYLSPSAYGWCSSHNVYSQGQSANNFSFFEKNRIDMEKNDFMSLVFDCDNRRISIENTRTHAKHALVVDTDSCPLPWQLHVILQEPKSGVRILTC
jgi:hypothetical protein